MKPSIFLSHNSKDKSFVRRLANDLRLKGVKVWLDEAEIRIGDSLIEKIREGIDQMEYLAVVLSKNSIESEWVKKEVDIAMNQEIKGKKVKVIPLMLDNCDIPWFLEGKLYADFTEEAVYKSSFSQILRRLGIDSRLSKGNFDLSNFTPEELSSVASIADEKIKDEFGYYKYCPKCGNATHLSRRDDLIYPDGYWQDIRSYACKKCGWESEIA